MSDDFSWTPTEWKAQSPAHHPKRVNIREGEMLDDTRPFPVMGEHRIPRDGGPVARCTIPWWLAEEAYRDYARRYGGGQTLDELAARGGFSRDELLDHLGRLGPRLS